MRRRGRRVFGNVYAVIENAGQPNSDAGRDVMVWRHGRDDFKDHFTTRATWDHIRIRQQEVSWHQRVWLPQGVPRQAFIVWLTFKDRLSMGVRMRQWGITQGCMFCGERDESREHLSNRIGILR